MYPLHAKRALSSSSENSVAQEHKKQKISHPTFKRVWKSEGSGNPAPQKKMKPEELSPYEDSDIEEELSPMGKILKALRSDSNDTIEEYYYKTGYDNDDSEIIKKGEKRKHESSTSNPEQRIRRKKKVKKHKKQHEKLCPGEIKDGHSPSGNTATHVDKAEGRGPDNRDIIYELTRDVTVDGRTPSGKRRKRHCGNHTTDVLEKRINMENTDEMND